MHITFACEVPEANFASFGRTDLAGDPVGRDRYTDGPKFSLSLFLSLYLSGEKQCLCNSNTFLLNSKSHVLPFPLPGQREKCEDRSSMGCSDLASAGVLPSWAKGQGEAAGLFLTGVWTVFRRFLLAWQMLSFSRLLSLLKTNSSKTPRARVPVFIANSNIPMWFLPTLKGEKKIMRN